MDCEAFGDEAACDEAEAVETDCEDEGCDASDDEPFASGTEGEDEHEETDEVSPVTEFEGVGFVVGEFEGAPLSGVDGGVDGGEDCGEIDDGGVGASGIACAPCFAEGEGSLSGGVSWWEIGEVLPACVADFGGDEEEVLLGAEEEARGTFDTVKPAAVCRVAAMSLEDWG